MTTIYQVGQRVLVADDQEQTFLGIVRESLGGSPVTSPTHYRVEVLELGATMRLHVSDLAELPTFAVLYSYPTSDRYYRGQRGVRVQAANQADALELIRKGAAGYPACPGAEIVRCKVVA